MCGIFGWIGAAPTDPQSLIEQQSRLLYHRGPDDSGFEHGDGWGFGFRRLSILDLSPLGHQPMRTPDGRFWLVFNGEIYNHVELRQELRRKGEHFSSTSDTEVLLRMLMLYGPGALTRLNGMFALAFVDTHARTFLLARDRLGQKPLYYHVRHGHLRFASELKALLAWPDASRTLNHQAVAEYLTYSYLPNERCIFHGYTKLAPAHFLMGHLDDPQRAMAKPYWRLQIEDGNVNHLSADDLQEQLCELFSDAVRIRMRSDVPVGLFLSGGLDSGLVTMLAARAQPDTLPVALTVGFENKAYDETDLATAVAHRAGVRQQIIPQQPTSLTNVDQIAWYYDEPFADASALPTMALCAAAAQHATVFLSGDGGDEAFAGYRRYIEMQRNPWLAHLPAPARMTASVLARMTPLFSSLRYRLLKASLPDSGVAATYDGIPNDPIITHLLTPELAQQQAMAGQVLWEKWASSRGAQLTARQQLLDYEMYLPDDILVKVDRASMAHSIEVRSPLLDYRLVEWAARLPRSLLIAQNQGKQPLRSLGKRLLPPAVQQGGKRGFGVPLDAWFRAPEGAAFLRQRVLSPEAKRRNLWDCTRVEALIQRHAANGGRQFGEYLWRLLVLDAWARTYVDEPRFLQGAPNMTT